MRGYPSVGTSPIPEVRLSGAVRRSLIVAVAALLIDCIVIIQETNPLTDICHRLCVVDWMTFDDYLTEHQLDGHPLGRSDPRLGTRSRHCVVEVLFRFPTSSSCESKEEVNVSVCQFEGQSD